MSKESDAMCRGLSGIADRWLKGDRRHRVLSEQQKEAREWAKLARKIEKAREDQESTIEIEAESEANVG